MQIDSSRFGRLEVRDDTVLSFPDGLIGLPGTSYALVAQSERTPFYWLHSAEHADVAVPVTMPWLFFANYEVRVPDEDAARLLLSDPGAAEIFCVVRAAPDIADFTINLAGPVIVNTSRRIGRQIINAAGGYAVRQPLFAEVELNEVRADPVSMVVPATATT
ncbi:MAG TPA: flagellar assembly protein FliW [Gaiellaceae bacterium]|nr:flagellar assembly protein FliW [Gaiellaceae bacterium]